MENTNVDPKEMAPVPASTPAVTPAPAPTPVANGEIPKTTGKTPGGWNRFAGYNPNAVKDKKNDRRDNKGRR